MMKLEPICSPLPLWRWQGETNGYLLVQGNRSFLIDCPGAGLPLLCQEHGLPMPDTILHTHVQEEHCREWMDLASAAVYLPAAAEDMARRAARFWEECRTVWPPSRAWQDERGREKYGFGGCTTERPPAQPLRVCGVLRPGDIFEWQGLHFEVLALPGSGRYAQGLYWREGDCCFCGDLLRAGGFLVNLYDLERCYGKPFGYQELVASLTRVAELAPRYLLPSAGPVCNAPRADCERLLSRVQWVFAPPSRRDGERRFRNFSPQRKIGRYVQIMDGLYQSDNAGNIILFVADDGHGLMIDPDPCIWDPWEMSQRAFHEDLDLLEREAGLKKVEIALVTHYHGDHCECAPLLKKRYGTLLVATPDVAALLAKPQDFPYPALLPWYAFPFDRLVADAIVHYGKPFHWREMEITPLHLPGHCWAHAGFLCQWRQRRIICSGDTFQYGDGPINVPLPICYSDTAWPERGVAVALRRMRAARPDLLLGGHSHACAGDIDAILEDFLACAAESEIKAKEMVWGDLTSAMTPPHYDEVRRKLDSFGQGMNATFMHKDRAVG